MNETLQAINLILGIVVSCVAIGGILAKLNTTFQTQASIDLLALVNLRPHIWNIDKRRMAAIVLGAILYSAAVYITSMLDYATVAPNWDWVYFLPVAVLLFFGVVFGPWVGLFVGVAGEGLIAIIEARVNSSSFLFPTAGAVRDAILGFIAGLSFAYTRGRFNNVRSIIVVEIIGAIGIVFGDLFYSIITQNQYYSNGFQGSFSQTFMVIILPDLVCGLVLLPLLLTLYDKSIAYES